MIKTNIMRFLFQIFHSTANPSQRASLVISLQKHDDEFVKNQYIIRWSTKNRKKSPRGLRDKKFGLF